MKDLVALKMGSIDQVSCKEFVTSRGSITGGPPFVLALGQLDLAGLGDEGQCGFRSYIHFVPEREDLVASEPRIYPLKRLFRLSEIIQLIGSTA